MKIKTIVENTIVRIIINILIKNSNKYCFCFVQQTGYFHTNYLKCFHNEFLRWSLTMEKKPNLLDKGGTCLKLHSYKLVEAMVPNNSWFHVNDFFLHIRLISLSTF